MIAFLRGRILDKQPNLLIVDVQGVGYHVNVPLSTFYDVGEAGAEVSLRSLRRPRRCAAVVRFLTTLKQQIFDGCCHQASGRSWLSRSVSIEPGELNRRHSSGLSRAADAFRARRKTAERMVSPKDRLAQLVVRPVRRCRCRLAWRALPSDLLPRLTWAITATGQKPSTRRCLIRADLRAALRLGGRSWS